jgi:hypothetical protein
MEIDAAAAAATAQATTTAPTVLGKVKKEMTSEARTADSKKRVAQRAVARQRDKDKKLAEERAKQAKLLRSVHARATANALAKQTALHVVAMMKGEVVNQFTSGQFGSTASSVSFTAVGRLAPPCVIGSVFDARAASPTCGLVAFGRAHAALAEDVVYGGRWRVPAPHRPQPRACGRRVLVGAQQGSPTAGRRRPAQFG